MTMNRTEYTGRENDETGLYFYRARYFDPVLKRFVSEDPIGTEGGLNLYTYVEGNPVSFTDPEGLSPFGDGNYGGVNLACGVKDICDSICKTVKKNARQLIICAICYGLDRRPPPPPPKPPIPVLPRPAPPKK